jgi:hypothetical protein
MPREKTNEKEGERERKRGKKLQKGKTLVFILKLRKKPFFTQKRHLPTEIFSLSLLFGLFSQPLSGQKGKRDRSSLSPPL